MAGGGAKLHTETSNNNNSSKLPTDADTRTGNDGDAETDSGSLLVPLPPDGGWGWVVTLASFMVGVIVDGICFTFGFFFLEFQDYFNANRSTTASINSVLTGTYLTVGTLVSTAVG